MHIRLSSRWSVAALLLLVPVALFAKPPLDDDGMPPMFIAKAPVGTALGTATSSTPTANTTLAGVTVTAGSTLIVTWAEIDLAGPNEPTTATFDGNAMTFVFLSTDGDAEMGVALFYYYSAATVTGDVVIVNDDAGSGDFQSAALTARSWTRIQSTTPDEGTDVSAASGTSLSMDFLGTATDVLVAAAAHRDGVTGTWAAPMTTGQTASIGDLVLKEAYRSPSTASATPTINFTGSISSCGISAGFLRETP